MSSCLAVVLTSQFMFTAVYPLLIVTACGCSCGGHTELAACQPCHVLFAAPSPVWPMLIVIVYCDHSMPVVVQMEATEGLHLANNMSLFTAWFSIHPLRIVVACSNQSMPVVGMESAMLGAHQHPLVFTPTT